jgi:hypothetical protein
VEDIACCWAQHRLRGTEGTCTEGGAAPNVITISKYRLQDWRNMQHAGKVSGGIRNFSLSI